MVEDVLIAAGVMSVLFVVATGAAVFVVARRVRRRYRSVRARLWAVRGSQRDTRDLLRASTSAAVSSLGSPGWWVVQNRRHTMWRAVSSAEHAVGIAQRADAAVGDLPFVVKQVNQAATGLDAVLRASARQGSLREQDRMDCDRIVAAADELRTAALTSLRTGSHADTDTVVTAVRIEVAALAAGLRAAHG